MKRSSTLGPLLLSLGLALGAGAAPGCNCNPNNGNGNGDGGNGDASAGNGDGGGSGDGGATACGDNDPSCVVACHGPTCPTPTMFPLPSDSPPDPHVGADGVNRDPTTGYIILDSSHAAFDFLWIADDMDYGVGLVSKVSTKPHTPGAYPNGQKYGEVARYATVTCQSVAHDAQGNLTKLPAASKQGAVIGAAPPAGLCADGMTGCCAWTSSVAGPAPGGHEPVNLTANRPSRTAVDFNGDVWVANRAFGLQSSVTKIANTITDCVERNGVPGIQTSSDVNGDGIITTDCDGNNVPDDASTQCTGGKSHEFWGLDDECILFTVNTGPPDAWGRPLTLGQGATDFSPADAWAGTFYAGGSTGATSFYRIDGTTGLIKTTVALQQQSGVDAHSYGAAIDQFGILWAPNEGEATTPHLFYFDTNNTASQGMVTGNVGGGGFYGIAVDGYKDPVKGLIQQVWLGEVTNSGAYRYRPDRSGGFAKVGLGTWAHVSFTGGAAQGRGIGVDNRQPTSFAWVALDSLAGPTAGMTGAIGQIPTNIPDGQTALTTFYATTQNGTLGAGVAIDSDIWGINQTTSSATHFSVDKMGNVLNAATPDIVTLDDNLALPAGTKPHPYTYSDFTGFGLRNFTNPHGKYTWVQDGCLNATAGKTRWLKVVWDADTPPNTAVTLRVRSADDMVTLQSTPFVGPFTITPADLSMPPGPVLPDPSAYLQVEFDLTTTDKNATPALKSFQIISECLGAIG